MSAHYLKLRKCSISRYSQRKYDCPIYAFHLEKKIVSHKIFSKCNSCVNYHNCALHSCIEGNKQHITGRGDTLPLQDIAFQHLQNHISVWVMCHTSSSIATSCLPLFPPSSCHSASSIFCESPQFTSCAFSTSFHYSSYYCPVHMLMMFHFLNFQNIK